MTVETGPKASVSWIADEAWDRVATSLSSSVSLLGWRSRAQAPGLVVKGGQVDLEGSVDPANRPDLVLEAAVVAARKRARISRESLQRLVARAPAPADPWPTSTRERFVELREGLVGERLALARRRPA